MFSNPFFGGFSILFTVVPLFVLGVFVFVIGSSIYRWMSNNAAPRQNRPAKIVAKRPHTWGGTSHGTMHSHAHTSYYVTFEFEDGSRLELPVGSSNYGMMAEGDIGMFIHQGTRFIDFQREQF